MELLSQFPYLLGQALRIALSIGKGISDEERYQALHDIKVYLTKALEVYDRKQRPHLFTEGGYIKGTQISYIGSPSDKNVVMRSAVSAFGLCQDKPPCSCILRPRPRQGTSVGNLLGYSGQEYRKHAASGAWRYAGDCRRPQ